ncbi:MAG TPA: DNA polymerase III subunit delta' [Clostridia bacterium]|nr:DNA polymerase III subunit delta' [Clostridia bacterium]
MAMRTFAEILGQDVVTRHLRRAVAAGQVHHAYLFYGPDGVGKRTTAYALAAALNCLAPQEGNACGRCPACLAVAGGTHPDLYEINPQGKNIKIEQIRELQTGLSFKRWQGNYKVAVIDEADLMTEEAANSLLKMLEEPSGKTCFVLLTSRPQSILPTIWSRCQRFSFRAVPPELIEQILLKQGIAPAQAKLFARLSDGSPGRALAKLQDGHFLQVRQRALEFCRRLQEGGIKECFEVAAALQEDGEEEILALMAGWWRDLLVWQATQSERLLVNVDLYDTIRQEKIPLTNLKQVLRETEKARQRLRYNANRRLCFEVMTLRINQYLREGSG